MVYRSPAKLQKKRLLRGRKQGACGAVTLKKNNGGFDLIFKISGRYTSRHRSADIDSQNDVLGRKTQPLGLKGLGGDARLR